MDTGHWTPEHPPTSVHTVPFHIWKVKPTTRLPHESNVIPCSEHNWYLWVREWQKMSKKLRCPVFPRWSNFEPRLAGSMSLIVSLWLWLPLYPYYIYYPYCHYLIIVIMPFHLLTLSSVNSKTFHRLNCSQCEDDTQDDEWGFSRPLSSDTKLLQLLGVCCSKCSERKTNIQMLLVKVTLLPKKGYDDWNYKLRSVSHIPP